MDDDISHLMREIDAVGQRQQLLEGRMEVIERRNEEQHRENVARMQRIERALFNDDGESRLCEMLDILRASKLGATFLKWMVAVGSGLVVAWAAWKGIEP